MWAKRSERMGGLLKEVEVVWHLKVGEKMVWRMGQRLTLVRC